MVVHPLRVRRTGTQVVDDGEKVVLLIRLPPKAQAAHPFLHLEGLEWEPCRRVPVLEQPNRWLDQRLVFLVFCLKRGIEVVRVGGYPSARAIGNLKLAEPSRGCGHQVELYVVQFENDGRVGLVDF